MINIAHFFHNFNSLCTLPWNHMVHTTAASVCSYYLLTTYMSNDFSEPWFVGLNGTKIYLKSPMTWCCTKGALRKIFYFFDLIFFGLSHFSDFDVRFHVKIGTVCNAGRYGYGYVMPPGGVGKCQNGGVSS